MPAGEDSGAKPKDYKLPPPPKDVGAAIDKLEHQEKALEEKLKTLTHKKILDDISLLKAQRDELKRQVLRKREMCEKDRVCKEIEELRIELSSLEKDSVPQAQPVGASGGVTIKDLRKMDSLNRAVDSKYSPVYFDDDEDEDDEVTSRTLRGKTKSKKIKSGKAAKSSEISVKKPQHWPHSFVPGQISDHKDIEYKDLSMTQFVAGYCAILSHLLNSSDIAVPSEVTHRLHHLKSLMCFAHSYPWDCILDIHHEVLIEIERGSRKWGDNFSDIESLNLLLQRKSNTDLKSKQDKKKYWFCTNYQKGSCSKKSPHSAVIGNERKMVRHMCATCYLMDKSFSEHPETSDDCTHKSD